MLRSTVLAARPFGLSKSASVTLRPVTRNFSSFGPKTTINYFNAASNRSRVSPVSFWSKFSRTFMTDSAAVTARPTQAEAWKRYAVTAATVAGTIVATNVFLNRETRDGLSAAERSYLNESFQYTGGGLLFTAFAARSFFRSGAAVRIMSANPWLVIGVSLVGSIGTMWGAMSVSPERPLLKHALWLGFNGFQAATLSPLFFLSPALLGRAALYTCGVFGSLSYVGATAKNDTYLYMGGPLLAGVTVVALSALAPLALPLGVRGLAVSEAVSLYGGLAVFSGCVLYDTQKILHNARMAETGAITRDPIRESIGLELDAINIFIRLVQILARQGNGKK